MVQPNFLPRTLRGVGGVRLIDMPGVEYPPEMLHVRRGHSRRDGRPYKERPEWGISTIEAAGILHCSVTAARAALRRKHIRCRAVCEPGIPRALYWDRKQVDALAEARHPIVTSVPDKFLSLEETAALLRVGRSSLYRYTARRWLHPYRVRQLTVRGLRNRVYFRRAEVVKLGHHLRALKRRLVEMRQLLREMVAPVPDDEPAPVPTPAGAPLRPGDAP